MNKVQTLRIYDLDTKKVQTIPDAELKDLMRMLKEKLDEVFLMSIQQWEDGFRQASDMESDIGHWINIANTYARFGPHAPGNQRKEIFSIILSCFNNSPDKVLEFVQLRNLSRQEAEQLVSDLTYGKN